MPLTECQARVSSREFTEWMELEIIRVEERKKE